MTQQGGHDICCQMGNNEKNGCLLQVSVMAENKQLMWQEEVRSGHIDVRVK